MPEHALPVRFDDADDPLVVVDGEFTIRALNRAAGRLAGKPVEALRGRPCRELFGDSAGVLCSCPLAVAVRARVVARGWVADSDGRVWEVVCWPVKDGGDDVVVERFRVVEGGTAVEP